MLLSVWLCLVVFGYYASPSSVCTLCSLIYLPECVIIVTVLPPAATYSPTGTKCLPPGPKVSPLSATSLLWLLPLRSGGGSRKPDAKDSLSASASHEDGEFAPRARPLLHDGPATIVFNWDVFQQTEVQQSALSAHWFINGDFLNHKQTKLGTMGSRLFRKFSKYTIVSMQKISTKI